MVLWKVAAVAEAAAAAGSDRAVRRIQRAVGLEARAEAVGLARRSVEFNMGNNETHPSTPRAAVADVSIVHADFRTYDSGPEAADHPREQFDLITGTPPYFRVDFSVDASTQSVKRAVIRQGGMPTAVQSAPARCEFRGGLEAYCEAAVRLLKVDGTFCVCENYHNHDRALAAFAAHRLTLQQLYRIRGRVGRPVLFCVYVLQMERADKDPPPAVVTVTELAVRDAHGQWTPEYREQILDYMSIPAGSSSSGG